MSCLRPEKQRHATEAVVCAECYEDRDAFAARRFSQLREEVETLYAVEATLVTALSAAACVLKTSGDIVASDAAFRVIAEVRSRAHFLLLKERR